jgi:hypothetical protein
LVELKVYLTAEKKAEQKVKMMVEQMAVHLADLKVV